MSNAITIRRAMSCDAAARDFTIAVKSNARHEKIDMSAINVAKVRNGTKSYIELTFNDDIDPAICKLLLMAEADSSETEPYRTKKAV